MHSLSGGFYEACCSSAYDAARRAAIAALGMAASPTSPRGPRHSTVISGFGRLLVERHADRAAGRAFNRLEQWRGQALYGEAIVPREQAEEAVALAAEVIAASAALLRIEKPLLETTRPAESGNESTAGNSADEPR